jgi:hypothetical protein
LGNLNLRSREKNPSSVARTRFKQHDEASASEMVNIALITKASTAVVTSWESDMSRRSRCVKEWFFVTSEGCHSYFSS